MYRLEKQTMSILLASSFFEKLLDMPAASTDILEAWREIELFVVLAQSTVLLAYSASALLAYFPTIAVYVRPTIGSQTVPPPALAMPGHMLRLPLLRETWFLPEDIVPQFLARPRCPETRAHDAAFLSHVTGVAYLRSCPVLPALDGILQGPEEPG